MLLLIDALIDAQLAGPFAALVGDRNAAVPEQRDAFSLAMLAALIAFFLLVEDGSELQLQLNAINLVFWLETIAIIAFAIAWLVKGETLRALFGVSPD